MIVSATKRSKLWNSWRKARSLLLVVTGYIVAWILIHPIKIPLPRRPGIHCENVSFTSPFDGLSLRGWWLPAAGDRAVIFAHGYRGHRNDKRFLEVARELNQNGYHVLLFDFRGCGQSAGWHTTASVLEQHDLLGAIRFAAQEKGMKQIAVMGWSMGAAAAILAARQSQDVTALICDSPFDDLQSYLEQNLNKWTLLPKLFTPYIIQALESLIGIPCNESSPIWQIQSVTAPILLIHSRQDRMISHDHSLRLYAAAASEKELWLTEGAKHVESHLLHRTLYHEKVLFFLRKHMPIQ